MDGALRERELDAELVEASLDPPVELAADPPLLARPDLDPAADDDRGIGHAVEPGDLERLQDQPPPRPLAAHPGVDLVQHVGHRIDVLLVGHRDVEHPVGEVAGHVGDAVDRPERDGVHVAVVGAQRHGAHADRLDHPGAAAEVDHVADPDGVAEQDEEPVDDVLDELLRAEADGEADDAGAGQERGRLDAELAEHARGRDQDQQDDDAALGDRRRGPGAVAVADVALGVAGGDVAADPPGAEPPEAEAHGQDQGDAQALAQGGVAVRAGEPGQEPDAPGLEQEDHGPDLDRGPEQPGAERRLARRRRLARLLALAHRPRRPGRPVQPGEQEVGEQQHREGGQGGADRAPADAEHEQGGVEPDERHQPEVRGADQQVEEQEAAQIVGLDPAGQLPHQPLEQLAAHQDRRGQRRGHHDREQARPGVVEVRRQAEPSGHEERRVPEDHEAADALRRADRGGRRIGRQGCPHERQAPGLGDVPDGDRQHPVGQDGRDDQPGDPGGGRQEAPEIQDEAARERERGRRDEVERRGADPAARVERSRRAVAADQPGHQEGGQRTGAERLRDPAQHAAPELAAELVLELEGEPFAEQRQAAGQVAQGVEGAQGDVDPLEDEPAQLVEGALGDRARSGRLAAGGTQGLQPRDQLGACLGILELADERIDLLGRHGLGRARGESRLGPGAGRPELAEGEQESQGQDAQEGLEHDRTV